MCKLPVFDKVILLRQKIPWLFKPGDGFEELRAACPPQLYAKAGKPRLLSRRGALHFFSAESCRYFSTAAGSSILIKGRLL